MSTNKQNKSGKGQKVTFLLQPRPQTDPLALDNDAPKNVLIPKDGQDIEEVKSKLPDFKSDVFVSEREAKVGALDRANKPDNSMLFDPELLQAMSKDFDFEDPNNILEEDFVVQAGGLVEDEDGEFEEFDMSDLDEEFTEVHNMTELMDEVRAMRGQVEDESEEHNDEEDDRKTIFTNYSMTSSVMRRNQGLQDIDEHFERMYEKEYADDEEIGALDHTEIKGGQQSLQNLDQIKQLKKEVKAVRQRNHDDVYEPEIVSHHHKNAIIGDSDDDKDLVEVNVVERDNRVDCESILSNTSTLYNHPKLIVEPRRGIHSSKKTPSNSVSMDIDQDYEDSIDARGGPERQSIASSRASVLSKLSMRPPNETSENRRARKKALKAYRMGRRQEKKQNQAVFKAEQMNLAKQQQSNKPALRLS